MKSRFALLVGVLVIASMLLTACPAPTPQVVEKVVTQIVEQKVDVIQTVEVDEEGRRDPGGGEDRRGDRAPEATAARHLAPVRPGQRGSQER